MNRKVYSYLLRTYGRQPAYWVGVGGTIVQTLLMRVVLPLITARIAVYITKGDFHGARTYTAVYLLAASAGLVIRFAKDLVANRIENRVYGGLMVNFYQKLVGKNVAFFRDHQTGYLASTFRQHIDSTMELVRMFRSDILQSFISLTVPATVLMIVSWKVGLAALVVVIAQIVYVVWSSSAVNEERSKSHEVYRRISGLVSDDVTNIIAYKTAGYSDNAVRQMRNLADEETATFWHRRKKLAFLDAPRDIIAVTGTAAAYWVIIANAQSAAGSVGLIVLTTTYMIQIFNNVGALPDVIIRHDDLVTRLYPTMEYLTDAYESIKDPKNPVKLEVASGRIDIENMSFAYQDEKGNKAGVFSNFDLHIKGGEQIGVVGLSGAGKSTLASLLMRFDDIDSGSIKVDGTDIRDVKQEDLRQHIAYVPQEPLLFHRTIRENLEYFSKNLTDKQMVRAAEAAHAAEFIDKLPNGYDTLVGERGIKLSGGQKQRVVIARAILKNAPIMLFDEATSALDSESEKIIQKALPEILGKRTAIIIAHRLSTIAGLDRIIVMEDGRIIEDGTHAQLLKQKGRYYSLWQKQTNHKKDTNAELAAIRTSKVPA
ncbi:MAG TPA: ABC transporter ATP-binding protein [Candidatus Pristimantibacillus sp.]|jgi:ATP-binding cassette subfamily B protein|nr:ABC transporter ATP-binding protein [Candidatus Pristimantibacillus sp.]